MPTPFVAINRNGPLVEIVLDRPENGNLINAEMSDAIIAAVSSLDDEVKLVRIGSSGPDFCKGRQSPMPPADAKPSAETLRRVVAAPPLALYDALKAVRVPVVSVVRGEARAGIAVVRPPGHHAESNTAMGFCFFNNAGIAARAAQVGWVAQGAGLAFQKDQCAVQMSRPASSSQQLLQTRVSCSAFG